MDAEKYQAIISDLGRLSIACICRKHRVGRESLRLIIIDQGAAYVPYRRMRGTVFSADDVLRIRAMKTANLAVTNTEIAALYGCDPRRICDILTGRRWSGI